jgi:DNA invertase Pin-like site-specific DNA recombinase
MNKQTRFVAYYRVSTNGQGRSGLGLEAQEACIRQFTAGAVIVGQFTEVESGKRDDRPQLRAAIESAKTHKAVLIIAKLDRLSRNVRFIFELRDSGVDFVCCDMPEANTLTVGIFATIAQHERELISQRTKAALAAKRARGEKLGNPQHFTQEGRAKGHVSQSAAARENAATRQAAAFARMCRKQSMSLSAIARELNQAGFRTRYGKQFQAKTVQRLLALS